MPITITPLTPTPVWGPGVPFTVQSDFIGPLPAGSFWDVRALTHPDENLIAQYRAETSGPEESLVWWNPGLVQNIQPLSNVTFSPKDGDLVDVEARLFENNATQIDIGTLVQLPWESTNNEWATTTTQGDFTETDRQTITTTEQIATDIAQFVQSAVNTATGAALLVPISSIIAHPDLHLMNLWGPPFTLTGRGVKDGDPAHRFTFFYGILWQVTKHPPGAGLLDGFVQQWTVRVAQFCMLHYTQDASRLYVQQVHETSQDNGVWLWDEYAPYQFAYNITEGWELTCQWLFA